MESLPGGASAPQQEQEKATGFSQRALFALGGVLVIMLLAIIFAFHKKAEQQAHPNKNKPTAQGVLSDVVKGVSADNGSNQNETPTAVPSFVQDMPTSRPTPEGTIKPVSSKNSINDKDIKKGADSTLKMAEDDDYDPYKRAEEAREKEKSGPPSTKDIMKMVMANSEANNRGDQEAIKNAELTGEKIVKDEVSTLSNVNSGSQGGGGNRPYAGGMGMMTPGGMMMGGGMSPTNPTPTQVAEGENKWLKKDSALAGPAIINVSESHPGTPYFLNAGDNLPAVLTRAIDTDNPGTVRGIVTHDMYNDAPGHENEVLVPANSILIGKYNNNVQFGQTRVQVVWDRLILPNGTVVPINGEGADMQGISGFHDQVNNHYMKIFGGVLLMSMFDVGPMMATPSASTSQLSGGGAASMLGESVGMNASEFGMQYATNVLTMAPTLTIRDGFAFNVFLPSTVVFQKYYSVVGEKPVK